MKQNAKTWESYEETIQDKQVYNTNMIIEDEYGEQSSSHYDSDCCKRSNKDQKDDSIDDKSSIQDVNSEKEANSDKEENSDKDIDKK
jgi:hypothetical protein